MQLSCPASASSCTQRENDFSSWDNLWPDASGGLQNHRGWKVANSAVAYPTVAYPAVFLASADVRFFKQVKCPVWSKDKITQK